MVLVLAGLVNVGLPSALGGLQVPARQRRLSAPSANSGRRRSKPVANSIKLYPTERKRVHHQRYGRLQAGWDHHGRPTRTIPNPHRSSNRRSIVERGDVITVYDEQLGHFKIPPRRQNRPWPEAAWLRLTSATWRVRTGRSASWCKREPFMLRTNGDDSRQSFFEVNLGSVVASINNLQAVLIYDPSKNFLDVKYIDGKIHVSLTKTTMKASRLSQSEYNGSHQE
jgi:hypothetical protein